MHIYDIISAHIKADLPDGFKERKAFDIANSSAAYSSGFCTRMQPWLSARWVVSNRCLLGVSCW